MRDKFYKQVDFLLEILALLSREDCFALKGGTAINMFYQNLPRLSVDIDLTYLGNENREQALVKIDEAIKRVKKRILNSYKDSRITDGYLNDTSKIIKLLIAKQRVQVKVEVNPVIRQTLFPVEYKTLTKAVIKTFQKELDFQVLSIGDLYGGKIVAALDRQHPRDIFDIKLMFDTHGISEEIKNGFIYYFISHSRPPNEVISPNLKDQRKVFLNEFEGMTVLDFSYQDFEKTRDLLITKIKESLSENDKKFLLSFFKGEPEWDLFLFPNLKDFPSVKWKLRNLKLMDKDKRAKQLQEFENKII